MRGELFAFRAANMREGIEGPHERALEFLGRVGGVELRRGVRLEMEPAQGHLPRVLAPPFGGEHALVYGDMASKPA